MADTQFLADLAAFQQQVEKEAALYITAIVTEVLTDIVTETPIDTGRAKASWAVALGAPAFVQALDVTPLARLSASEAEAKALDTLKVLEGFKLGTLIDISNGLIYISRLEEGHSQQSSHMVARALAKQDHVTLGGTP